MEKPEKMPGRRLSPGVVFTVGALAGAIAVFVPLVSLGHPGPRVARPELPSSRAVGTARVSPPQTGGATAPGAPDAGTSSRAAGSNGPDNAAGCDVQLD